MKKDEKACPKCAETIKLAAERCKHCAAEFSPDEVEQHNQENRAKAAERAQARADKKIDEGLAETLPIDRADFAGYRIRPHEIEEVAAEITVPYARVLERAVGLGMVFTDRPAPVHESDWSQSLSAEIERDIHTAVVDGVVPLDTWIGLEDRHNVSGITTRIRTLGLAFVNESSEVVDDEWERRKALEHEEWKEKRNALKKELKARFRYTGIDESSISELCAKYERSRRSVIAAAAAEGISIGKPNNTAMLRHTDSQYGVLQPAANLFAGCLNIWLWAFLLFCLAGLIVVVKSFFE